MAQQFLSSEDQLLQVSKYRFDELVMQPKISDFRNPPVLTVDNQDISESVDQVCQELGDVWYPLVITMVTKDTPHMALLTFCNLVANDEHEYEIQPLKQKLYIEDTAFLVQKIYGRSQADQKDEFIQSLPYMPSK
ncbi:hypothetical protein K493DRAFT_356723 [Basidiobolus meristosporus CBS 931.73]|uniref:Uncharacterized protein n=1 Tax=Basidiobolus meristosporus CBS 931.73 TaxID=1314790 RepID=A0A1Y1XXY6_9FUNG|nr:hypothetical protein K493DRAFT_356723 [Basidiobolus meristosporus CBS 931.73]|eukprot:ORX90515.1 hypothetical protein K493DRAFT_356723 [Basidiobolus meristosporus CBS 931.73]